MGSLFHCATVWGLKYSFASLIDSGLDTSQGIYVYWTPCGFPNYAMQQFWEGYSKTMNRNWTGVVRHLIYTIRDWINRPILLKAAETKPSTKVARAQWFFPNTAWPCVRMGQGASGRRAMRDGRCGQDQTSNGTTKSNAKNTTASLVLTGIHVVMPKSVEWAPIHYYYVI